MHNTSAAGLLVRVSLLLLLLFTSQMGCSPAPPCSSNCNDNQAPPELEFQPSPSGQIMAVIDADGFERLLRLSVTEPRPTLQPLIDNYLQTYSERFASLADFIIFTIDAHRDELRFTSLGGFNITVRAPESGLGPFVPMIEFDNLPRLRSYIYLARKDSLVLGPGLHELAHAWGVRFKMPEELGEQSTSSGNHWGYSGVGGQLGGWMPGTLIHLGGGEFKLSDGNVEPNGRSFNSIPFAPLELYIMGLESAEHVPPFEVAVRPVFKSLFEFSADGVVEITIDDLIAKNGPRVPDVHESQKQFNAALLVLTDHRLDEEEWQFYEDSVAFFGADHSANILEAFPESRYRGQKIRELIIRPDPEDRSRTYLNFFDAAGGRATLDFVVPQPAAPRVNNDPLRS